MDAKYIMINELGADIFAARQTAEAAIEGVLPLPAGMHLGDIEPICSAASIDALTAAAHDGAVDIEGRIRVSVIYRHSGQQAAPAEEGAAGAQAAADSGGAFTSSAVFKYTMAIDAAREGMRANVSGQVQACSVEYADKLTLNAVAGLDCALFAAESIAMLDPAANAECEIKRQCIISSTETRIGGGDTEFETEAALSPNAQPLYAAGECSVRNVNLGGGIAITEGQLMLGVLLSTRAGLITQNLQFPFSVETEVDAHGSGEIYARAQLKDIAVTMPDDSGGLAFIRAKIGVDVYSCTQIEAQLSADAFIPYTNAEAQRRRVNIMQRGKRKTFRHTLSEIIPLPPDAPALRSAVCCAAMPYITDNAADAGVFGADGVISLNCALSTADGGIYSFGTQLPFLCEAQCSFADTGDAFADIKCLNAALLLTGGMLTLECTLEISAVPYSIAAVDIVTAIDPGTPQQRRRAIVLYYASNAETPFDIAKRYALPTACLNGADAFEEGQRILFLS